MTTLVKLVLTDFLLARFAEDEARYRSWVSSGEMEPTLGDHLLAECDAKRRIVQSRPAIGLVPSQTVNAVHGEVRRQRDYIWRLLALPYAGHADYREDWRP